MNKIQLNTKTSFTDKLEIIINKKNVIINASIDNTGNTFTILREELIKALKKGLK